MTCNNPVIGATSTWLSASAIDREGDAAYLARCLARWATLGSGFTRDAVAYWCRSAETSPGVNAGATRISFGPVPGDGTYTVYVAGASGVLARLARDLRLLAAGHVGGPAELRMPPTIRTSFSGAAPTITPAR